MEKETKEIYKENFTEYLLCLALDVGEGMLKNGGEVARVEDTISRICRAYGALHVEVFTIVSVIHASIRMKDGSYSSQMRRVHATGIDLSAVERLNRLSREVCRTRMPLSYFDAKIHEAKSGAAYPKPLLAAAFALGASSFAVFFGGGIWEAVTAALGGLLLYLVDSYSGHRMNAHFKTVLSSFAACLVAALSAAVIGADGGAVIMGSIMLLVPGVALGVAMRDLLCGDIIAGSLKLLQALLTALMIAFGYILVVSIVGGGLI